LQNHSEFVAADPENRTVLEYTADQPTGGFYVNVAFVVSVLIVYNFKIVAVKDTYRELHFLFLIQPVLQFLNIIGKGALVPD